MDGSTRRRNNISNNKQSRIYLHIHSPFLPACPALAAFRIHQIHHRHSTPPLFTDGSPTIHSHPIRLMLNEKAPVVHSNKYHNLGDVGRSSLHCRLHFILIFTGTPLMCHAGMGWRVQACIFEVVGEHLPFAPATCGDEPGTVSKMWDDGLGKLVRRLSLVLRPRYLAVAALGRSSIICISEILYGHPLPQILTSHISSIALTEACRISRDVTLAVTHDATTRSYRIPPSP